MAESPKGTPLRLKVGAQRFRVYVPAGVPFAARAKALRELADRLRKASPGRARILLEEAARAGDDRDFAGVAALAAKEPDAPEGRGPVTFSDLAAEWTSGRLAMKYPDRVRAK